MERSRKRTRDSSGFAPDADGLEPYGLFDFFGRLIDILRDRADRLTGTEAIRDHTCRDAARAENRPAERDAGVHHHRARRIGGTLLRHEGIQPEDPCSRGVVLNAGKERPKNVFHRQLTFQRQVLEFAAMPGEELMIRNAKIQFHEGMVYRRKCALEMPEHATEMLKRER